MTDGQELQDSLEYTPTWAVAVVCSVMVLVSLALERGIHRLGKSFKRKNQKPLFEALQKLKEELMLLGFISLLLTVFQNPINHLCIPKSITLKLLPCKFPETEDFSPVEKFSHWKSFQEGHRRKLLSSSARDRCGEGKRPLLSSEGMHQLHIFIFVLAIVHVIFCVLTMLLGTAKIRTWKSWEEEIRAKGGKAAEPDGAVVKVTHVAHHDFVKTHSLGRKSIILSWMVSFFKQFYGSVTKTDYAYLRLGFIEAHCKGNPTFDFHKYMMRTLEADFKKVVGISGILWAFVVIFLLLNVDGWHTYFWIAFIPLLILLAVGAKLEHVISQLAHEVLDKHTCIEGDIVVRPSDQHFWFERPKLVLHLIHFILFQNAFEIAFFFWILTTYGMDSCFMGKLGYIIPRLAIGVLIQVLCSYSTLPLYALVTQMGSTFKKSIFEEHIQQGLSVWHAKAKQKMKRPDNKSTENASNRSTENARPGIQMPSLQSMSVENRPSESETRVLIDSVRPA